MFLQETFMSHLHICRNGHLSPSPYRQALTGRGLHQSAQLESLGNSQTFLMDVHAPHLSLLPELCVFFHVFGAALTIVSTTTFPEVNMLKAKDVGSRLHSLSWKNSWARWASLVLSCANLGEGILWVKRNCVSSLFHVVAIRFELISIL